MMSRAQRMLLHAAVALMTATGAIFAWTKYFLTPPDEFALANHPLQPWMLAAHVVLAPLLVFAVGWIFGDHILVKLGMSNAPKRKSGIWTMVMLAPMVLSGYLLQVLTDDALRDAMRWAHWISSAFFAAGYAVHLITKPAGARSTGRGGPASSPSRG
jgi:hypothetical protein